MPISSYKQRLLREADEPWSAQQAEALIQSMPAKEQCAFQIIEDAWHLGDIFVLEMFQGLVAMRRYGNPKAPDRWLDPVVGLIYE